MDKLIIEFNKKFDKQKQELIDGFKALGEEKRLPKALATIEGEQPTYKNYFKAGWQSRQAEVDQQKLLTVDSELHLDAAKEEIERLKAQLGIKRDQIKGFESEIKKVWQAVDEKDKRIEEALNHLNDVRNKGMDQSCYLAIKALRGNNANS